nr:hypothetical protein [uncultured Mediterranean phage uvMED]
MVFYLYDLFPVGDGLLIDGFEGVRLEDFACCFAFLTSSFSLLRTSTNFLI